MEGSGRYRWGDRSGNVVPRIVFGGFTTVEEADITHPEVEQAKALLDRQEE